MCHFVQRVGLDEVERDADRAVVDTRRAHRRPVGKCHSQFSISPTTFPELGWYGHFVEVMAAVLDRTFGPERDAVLERPVDSRPVDEAVANKVAKCVVAEQAQTGRRRAGVGYQQCSAKVRACFGEFRQQPCGSMGHMRGGEAGSDVVRKQPTGSEVSRSREFSYVSWPSAADANVKTVVAAVIHQVRLDGAVYGRASPCERRWLVHMCHRLVARIIGVSSTLVV